MDTEDTYDQWNKDSKQVGSENWNKHALSGNIFGIGMAMGIPTQEEAENLLNGETEDGENQSLYVPKGALGATTRMISYLYNPPASGIEYLANLKNNLLGKPAYAQGAGFTGLQPILPIWKAFRNVVYIISSLLFILLGLMVMFRIKSGPQTVVTIQNAIPKIITALILVTFSYAIAGLLIDIGNFILAMFLALLFKTEGLNLNNNLFKEDLFQRINFTSNRYDFAHLIQAGHTDFIELAFLAVPKLSLFFLGMLLGGTIGAAIGIVSGPAAAATTLIGLGVGPIIIIIIITILILIWLLKFFFGAMLCYIKLIFRIVIGPLEIAMGAIPGIKIGFSSWLQNVIANLAVFPVSFLFLVITNLIIQHSQSPVFGHRLWAPRIVQKSATSQTVAFLSGGLVPVSIGLASLMLLSKLPLLIPQAIFMIKPTAWDNALGQSAQNVPIVTGTGRMLKSGTEGAIKTGIQNATMRFLHIDPDNKQTKPKKP